MKWPNVTFQGIFNGYLICPLSKHVSFFFAVSASARVGFHTYWKFLKGHILSNNEFQRTACAGPVSLSIGQGLGLAFWHPLFFPPVWALLLLSSFFTMSSGNPL